MKLAARHRFLLAVFAVIVAMCLPVLAMVQPQATTALGVAALALEGAIFLFLWHCRRT